MTPITTTKQTRKSLSFIIIPPPLKTKILHNMGRKRKRMVKKIIKYVITSLTVLFFLLSLIFIFLGIKAVKENKPVSIFGYIFSVVPTESMKPDINPGDFVLSKKVDFSTLEIGNDIVYYSVEKDIYIVHRIYNQKSDGSFVMFGINNPGIDNETVDETKEYPVIPPVYSLAARVVSPETGSPA